MLLPLAWFYCAIVFIRKLTYKFAPWRVVRFSVPVIVVGNLTVGGSGKTPLVIHLANFLKKNGLSPGIVSRGYGRLSFAKDPLDVSPDLRADETGDEPLLLARETLCPVVVDTKRARGVQRLIELGVNVVLSDDGMQHYAMSRDMEIAVVDGQYRYGNKYCLPAGPLREPMTRLSSVDMVVCNGNSRAGEKWMRLVPGEWVNLVNPDIRKKLDTFRQDRVQVIAGIGNPKRFFQSIAPLLKGHRTKPYPDHYRYKQGDLIFDDSEIVIMTAKDAVKCAELPEVVKHPDKYWYLGTNIELDKEIEVAVLVLAKRKK